MTARTSTDPARDIPEATVARLPVYLRALITLAEQGIGTCSSEELATAAGVNSAKLRKDLSYLGSYGTRGVGYDVEYLRYQIAREIGVTQDWPVVIVGIGNLGHALAKPNYSFEKRQRELAKKKKKEQKEKDKAGRKLGTAGDGEAAADGSAEPAQAPADPAMGPTGG